MFPLDVNPEDVASSLLPPTGVYYEGHSVETEDPDLNLRSVTHSPAMGLEQDDSGLFLHMCMG